MASQLMTIEDVAQQLNLHVKTVRRYVTTGRLKGRRIGKEYRILRADFEAFAGAPASAGPTVPVVTQRHVVASTIVDVTAISPTDSQRVTTMVMASLNARRGEGDAPRVDCIQYPEQGKLRITITATLDITCELLKMIDALAAPQDRG
jgi:excisionase family DNA binding protein